MPESGFNTFKSIPMNQPRPGQAVLPEVFPATLPNPNGFEQSQSAIQTDAPVSQQPHQKSQPQTVVGRPQGHDYKTDNAVSGVSPQHVSPSTSVDRQRRTSISPQILIPTLIRWNKPGEQVYVAGSFNDWRYKIKLHRTETEWQAVVDLPSGTHCIKFIVDDEWQCSNDLIIAPDDDSNLVNYINVDEHYRDTKRPVGLRMELGGMEINDDGDWGDDSNVEGLDSTQLSGSPPGGYSDEIPDWNQLMARYRESSSGGSRRKEPPLLPPHLNNVLLNSADPPKNDPNVLPAPNHVVLSHLYACSIKDNVMAVSTTSRYRGKVNPYFIIAKDRYNLHSYRC